MNATSSSPLRLASERYSLLATQAKGAGPAADAASKELQTYQVLLRGLGVDVSQFEAASPAKRAEMLSAQTQAADAFETLLKASSGDLGWSVQETASTSSIDNNLRRIFGLEREVALVTGGGSGIGREFALGLAAAGAKVAVMGRRPEELQAVVDEIRERGGQAVAVAADVTKPDQVSSSLEEIREALGDVSVLVNNAGIADHSSLEDASLEQIQRILEVNVTAPTMMIKAVSEHMKRVGGGSIINIESTTTTQGSGKAPLYGISKGAVGSLTTSAAKALAADNIHVNAIVPGFIDSSSADPSRQSMSDWMREGTEAFQLITDRTPLGRVGKSEDLVGAAVYFAAWRDGQAGSFSTGAQNRVDGGIMNADPL